MTKIGSPGTLTFEQASSAQEPIPSLARTYGSITRRLEEAQSARQRSSQTALEAKGAEICSHLLERHPRCPAASFAFFLPLLDEPDLLPVAQAWFKQGAIACLPAPRLPGEPLSFWPWDFEAPLERGESWRDWPKPHTSDRALLPELILAPCALFDQAGRRAGYGHGLYQSTLRAARSTRPGILIIGCSLEWSRVEHGAIPGEPMLDGLATEAGFFDTTRPKIKTAPSLAAPEAPTQG
jgi:5,10-methenyltetrahydrofolate synthetase